MKYLMQRKRILNLTGGTLIAMGMAASAGAADFEQRKLAEIRSAAVGLGRSQIQLLKGPGPGQGGRGRCGDATVR